MAGVVIHAQMSRQRGISRVLGAHPVNECSPSPALVSRKHSGSGSRPRWRSCPCARRDVRRCARRDATGWSHRATCSGVLDEFLKRAGEVLTLPSIPAGSSCGEQIEQAVGVIEPFAGGPVGRINLFLHPCAMESAEGKSVDREDVAVVLIQPPLELRQSVPESASCARRLVAQPQTNRIRLIRADSIPHG